MAKKITVDLELKYKEAVTNLNEFQKEYSKLEQENKKLQKSTAGVGSTLDKVTGGAITKFQNFRGSIGSTIRSFKSLKVAIAATGIGALVLAITSVTAAFKSSEEGQNKFRKFFSQIQVVIGNVTDLLADFGMAIINVFSGNFKEAKKNIDAVVDGIKNFGEETRKEIEIAGELADMRAKADKAERDLITSRAEANRKVAELREIAADKENISVQERIAAIKEAGRVEEEITKREIEAARLRFEAKQQENALSKSTKEDLDEEARLKARLTELETGRLRIQKALTAELTATLREEEAERKRIEAEKKAETDQAAKEKKEADDKARADELAAEKALADLKKQIRDAEAVSDDEKRALEIEKVTEHYNNLIALAEKNGIDVTNLEAAKTKRIEELNKTEVVISELTGKQKVQIAMDTLQLIGMIAGEGSKIGKAAAIAQATISTVEGTINAFKTAADSPITTLFPPYPFIQAGIAAAAGLANINKIKSVKVGSNIAKGAISSASIGGAGAGGAAPPAPPAFNVVGAGGINQLATAIGEQQQQPVKAFVVSNDVSTAQELDRNIVQGAAIG